FLACLEPKPHSIIRLASVGRMHSWVVGFPMKLVSR
ncbi:MAG: hypothetical protein QOJ34_1475, partial [Pseudonocardiales bacterium]|nr:hypothetical protein [Pseudonocardiales bacterium]